MRPILFIFLALCLQACKHPLEIRGEGDIVERLNGVRGCTLEEFQAASPRCTDNEVVKEDYIVSYEAIPRPGWVFIGWEGTACSTVTEEGFCEYNLEQAWIDFTDMTWPEFPFPSTIAVFKSEAEVVKMTLENVQYWAYNIQQVETAQQREELVGTHFDMYVLEPVISEKGQENFDIASLVHDIRQHNIDVRGVDPLIIGYIDVGQAEGWRWYFDDSWVNEAEQLTNQAPEWITGNDPDQWVGNYPVSVWAEAWEDVVIYGNQNRSFVQMTLEANFDGIYMDWVEAFSDDSVLSYLQSSENIPEDAVESESAERMFDFIEKIRSYARQEAIDANADYLIIAQNASDLRGYNSQRYDELIDAIALEGLFYEGVDGDCESFDNWDCEAGYNVPSEQLTGTWSQEVMSHITPLIEGNIMPVFCAEYAQDTETEKFATEVYEQLAPRVCIPYATRRSLSQLSKTPYPLGYTPDY